MLHYAGAPFSMTNPKMSFRAFLLCHSEHQRGIHSWMLHYAGAPFSMTNRAVIPSISFVSFRAPARNPLMDASLRWRFVQHDKPVRSFRAFLLCHSERQRGIHSWMLHYAGASFSMTNPKMSFRAFLLCHSEHQRGIHSWMLRFAQHDKTEDVIPNAVRNPLMDASLRSA